MALVTGSVNDYRMWPRTEDGEWAGKQMSGENSKMWKPSETEWAGMLCQRLSARGEGYTLTFLSTLTHRHPSTAPSLPCVSTMCLSRFPAKLAGLQHWGLSPGRLSRRAAWGAAAPQSYSWVQTWAPLLRSPFVLSALFWPWPASLLPRPPLWDRWLRSLSFNFQPLLLSVAVVSSSSS